MIIMYKSAKTIICLCFLADTISASDYCKNWANRNYDSYGKYN